MNNGVQIAFKRFYGDYRKKYKPSHQQDKAAFSIMNCKTGMFGANASICTECNLAVYHHNSCRNRNCPSCQAVLREIWIDDRNSEIIDAPYFHVVFTVPHKLNALFFANQTLLYTLFHKTVSKTLIQLASDKKFLGAVPGIIQVLHTWGQELNYHPHIHCIVTGAGLTSDLRFVKGRNNFFIPLRVLSKVFRGKFIHELQKLYDSDKLFLSKKSFHLKSPPMWQAFVKDLYSNDWMPFVKQTFKHFGNAVSYLGRYTHRIAISNNRIIAISENDISFSAKDHRNGVNRIVTIPGAEFIRRFLCHVLPKGFQKIRYHGFLNNRFKSRNLKTISNITGKLLPKRRFADMNVADIITALWGVKTRACPGCNCETLKAVGNIYMRN